MKVVASQEPRRLARAVLAESRGEEILIMGHEDGTVSYMGESLRSIWLNPGKAVTAVAAIGAQLLVAFSDSTICLFSIRTGLLCASVTLPFPVYGVSVLEHAIACWSTTTELWLLNRDNLDLLETLHTNSPVVSVFSSEGVVVVCSYDVYRFRSGALKLISDFDELIVAAVAYDKGWIIVHPKKWSIFSGDFEDFSVGAPDGAYFHAVKGTRFGVIIQCLSLCVIVHGNNIQVIESPQGFLTSSAYIITPELKRHALSMENGELAWKEISLPILLAEEKFLPGQSDPSVTAVYEATIGTADGRVDGVAALPGPILKLTSSAAYSRAGYVRIPLQDINIVKPVESYLPDCRVSIQLKSFPDGPWWGVEYNSCFALQPANLSPHIKALLALTREKNLDDLIDSEDYSLTSVAEYEDLAVYASEKNEELRKIVAAILSKVWDSNRISELLKVAGPRPLRVLSAVYPDVDCDSNRLRNIIESAFASSDGNQKMAALWVFEYRPSLVIDISTPFEFLSQLPRSAFDRFTRLMAISNGPKLVDDALTTLSSVATHPSRSSSTSTESDEPSIQSIILSTLLQALADPGSPTFLADDDDLVRLVASVTSPAYRRIAQTKSILVKLLTDPRVAYHQAARRLLINTSKSTSHAAVLFNLAESYAGPVDLLGSGKLGPLVFNTDGKSAHTVPPVKPLNTWNFTHGIRSILRSAYQPIEPVIEQS